MQVKTFNRIAEARLKSARDTLIPKGDEYTRNGDRLHNFRTAARIDNETPEKALWGMWKKHIASIRDIIHDIDKGVLPSDKTMQDKFDDNINYTLLLEGLIRERKGEGYIDNEMG